MTIKKTNTETGHVRNLANFQSLITVCTGYATSYNPSNASLSVAALKNIQTEAQKAVEAVATALAQYSSTVADREASFAKINTLTSKIINALKASGVKTAIWQNAHSIAKRITGQNKTPKPTGVEPTEKTISTAQLSYDRKVDNLNQLIQTLKTEPNYKPNETELKVDTLSKLVTDLIQKNNNVVSKATALSNARLMRNQKLYTSGGLVPIANATKAYAKSIFGTTSPQYKQLSSIPFTNKV